MRVRLASWRWRWKEVTEPWGNRRCLRCLKARRRNREGKSAKESSAVYMRRIGRLYRVFHTLQYIGCGELSAKESSTVLMRRIGRLPHVFHTPWNAVWRIGSGAAE